jgi:hypothetical protein
LQGQHSSTSPAKAVYNPLVPGFRENPHPQLHRLRAEDPVHWSPVLQVWVLTRHADVLFALRDPRFSASALHWENYQRFFSRSGSVGTPPPAEVYRHWMLQLDPPDHTRLRALVSKAFTPRTVEAFRPQIQRMTDDLLDRVQGRGEMDLVADLAYPLPIMAIATLLGTPPEDYADIRRWSADLLPSFGPAMSAKQLEHVSRVTIEFSEYFKSLIACRRASPENHLLDALIAARDGANQLTDSELVSTCILLIVAGHLTTVQLIARGTLLLLRNPDQLSLLRRSPEMTSGAIEEMLRLESPLQVVNRTALQDIPIGGKTIRKGQMVILSLAGANRDPVQFPDPDRFDITRSPNRHIAFGFGEHFCAGAPLARLEAQVVFPTLLRRFPDLSLLERPLDYESSLILRALKSLPVRLVREAA